MTGTTLFVMLLAVALFTVVAFAQAAASPKSENGNGKKLGHIYGVGNGGVPPGHDKNNNGIDDSQE